MGNKMIIFDLDGTLWDTVDATYLAAKTITEKYHIKEITKEQIINGMGLNFEENARNYMPDMYLTESKKYMQKINNECQKIISSENVKIYNNALSIIEELSKKYKLGIITNNNDDYINTFFRITKSKKYFKDYIGAGSYNISKNEAMKKMVKRNNASKSIYVGDTLKDKKEAQSAKLIFIYAEYGFGNISDYQYTINSLNELPNLIENINGE